MEDSNIGGSKFWRPNPDRISIRFDFHDGEVLGKITKRAEMDTQELCGLIRRKTFNEKGSMGCAFCERNGGIVGIDWAEERASFFPFPVEDVPGAFFKV